MEEYSVDELVWERPDGRLVAIRLDDGKEFYSD